MVVLESGKTFGWLGDEDSLFVDVLDYWRKGELHWTKYYKVVSQIC